MPALYIFFRTAFHDFIHLDPGRAEVGAGLAGRAAVKGLGEFAGRFDRSVHEIEGKGISAPGVPGFPLGHAEGWAAEAAEPAVDAGQHLVVHVFPVGIDSLRDDP